jgi:hypothetical protein
MQQIGALTLVDGAPASDSRVGQGQRGAALGIFKPALQMISNAAQHNHGPALPLQVCAHLQLRSLTLPSGVCNPSTSAPLQSMTTQHFSIPINR